MKIALLYNIVERASSNIPLPDNWDEILSRFISSYKQHTPKIRHDLYICSSGSQLSKRSMEKLAEINYKTFSYYGGGWDVGAYQSSAKKLLNYDVIVCINAQTHFNKDNWLEKIIEAIRAWGPGIYGASASFESAPHIRTSFMAFPPSVILSYPVTVKTRYEACVFEHSPSNFSIWAKAQGYSVRVVEDNQTYDLLELSKSTLGFRRGDQSQFLIQDRHSLIYAGATSDEKINLEKKSQGLGNNSFIYIGNMKLILLRIYSSIYTFKNFSHSFLKN